MWTRVRGVEVLYHSDIVVYCLCIWWYCWSGSSSVEVSRRLAEVPLRSPVKIPPKTMSEAMTPIDLLVIVEPFKHRCLSSESMIMSRAPPRSESAKVSGLLRGSSRIVPLQSGGITGLSFDITENLTCIDWLGSGRDVSCAWMKVLLTASPCTPLYFTCWGCRLSLSWDSRHSVIGETSAPESVAAWAWVERLSPETSTMAVSTNDRTGGETSDTGSVRLWQPQRCWWRLKHLQEACHREVRCGVEHHKFCKYSLKGTSYVRCLGPGNSYWGEGLWWVSVSLQCLTFGMQDNELRRVCPGRWGNRTSSSWAWPWGELMLLPCGRLWGGRFRNPCCIWWSQRNFKILHGRHLAELGYAFVPFFF